MNDEFVKYSIQEGYRARSAYKLIQILSKFPRIAKDISSSGTVIDLGASPGSWCQVLSKFLPKDTKIVAIDLLAMEPLEKVRSIVLDFSVAHSLYTLFNTGIFSSEKDFANLIVCDLCVNISGNSCIDNSRNMILWENALTFAKSALKKDSHFIIKIFESTEARSFFRLTQEHFKIVHTFKPKASRTESSEKYLICLNKKD